MKKEAIGLLIFLATISIITIPLAMLASGAATDNFSANANITNVAPDITYVATVYNNNTGPTAAGTLEIQIRVNATDLNQVDDFDDGETKVNITNGGTTRESHTCAAEGLSGTMESWLCNITINYYDTPGAWDITAYVEDTGGLSSTNDTEDHTVGNTDDIDVINATITFSGSPGQSDVGPRNIIINNTGNQNYATIALTGINLLYAANVLGVGNFSVNITASGGPGKALVNNSAEQIPDAVLNRGASSTEELFFYLDVPAAIAPGDYATPSNWIIDPSI